MELNPWLLPMTSLQPRERERKAPWCRVKILMWKVGSAAASKGYDLDGVINAAQKRLITAILLVLG